MSRLLYVSASPRSHVSESARLAEIFLQTYHAAHPEVQIDTLDLWTEPLLAFDGVKVGAKMTVIGGGALLGAEAEAWTQIVANFERFNAADLYLFTVPMWNSGIPYVLKQYIDIITQPGLLFGLTPEAGYSGLLTGKKAAAIYTSGVYAPGVGPAFGSDFHSSYFDNWLRFIGISDITTIRFQPTLLTPDVEGARQAAIEQARTAALTFGTPASAANI
ncbi:MAG TPA: NAD(P)H-dependent oxidoreductase [Ktedonobacteraceae bacterium]|nr:NAD(P)H-dependent oxidoreductase [Ktedonobacteraceae bacterium]